MKSGKVWGNTQLIEHNSTFEFHRIEFKANVCCSEHYHATKWNGFFVESGTLLIKTWQNEPTDHRPNMLCDQTVIGVDDGIAFELYWAEFDANDIVRRSTGKVLDNPPTEDHIGNPLTDLNAD
jgi:hypothetical protein